MAVALASLTLAACSSEKTPAPTTRPTAPAATARPATPAATAAPAATARPATPTATAAPAAATPAASGPVTLNVVATDNAFDKTALQAKAGQEFTLVMENKGQLPHNVHVYQSKGGPSVAASEPQVTMAGQKGTLKAKIDKSGSYYYQCDFHAAEMTGTLTMQ